MAVTFAISTTVAAQPARHNTAVRLRLYTFSQCAVHSRRFVRPSHQVNVCAANRRTAALSFSCLFLFTGPERAPMTPEIRQIDARAMLALIAKLRLATERTVRYGCLHSTGRQSAVYTHSTSDRCCPRTVSLPLAAR